MSKPTRSGSAAYAPLNTMPQQYEVVFTSDKATFKRLDGQIETKTEGDRRIRGQRGIPQDIPKKPWTGALRSGNHQLFRGWFWRRRPRMWAHPAFGNLFIETRYQADRKYVAGEQAAEV